MLGGAWAIQTHRGPQRPRIKNGTSLTIVTLRFRWGPFEWTVTAFPPPILFTTSPARARTTTPTVTSTTSHHASGLSHCSRLPPTATSHQAPTPLNHPTNAYNLHPPRHIAVQASAQVRPSTQPPGLPQPTCGCRATTAPQRARFAGAAQTHNWSSAVTPALTRT